MSIRFFSGEVIARIALVFTLSCSLIAVVPVQATAAPLLGSDIEATYLNPNTATAPFGSVTATVGAGIEFENTLLPFPSPSGSFNIDISESSIRIELVETPPTDTSISRTFSNLFSPPFNGFRFHDVNGTIDPITSVTIDPATTVPGFDDSRISFTDDEILIDLKGLKFETGLGVDDPGKALVLLNITLDSPAMPAVPEPTSLALWGIGSLGVAGYCGWRRRRRPGPAA